jgi:hypothetical protein
MPEVYAKARSYQVAHDCNNAGMHGVGGLNPCRLVVPFLPARAVGGLLGTTGHGRSTAALPPAPYVRGE